MAGRSLFAQVIGPSFDNLPSKIRCVHEGPASRRYAGRCTVVRGGGYLSRTLGWLARLPPAADSVALSVAITVHPRGEAWNRAFDACVVRSRLRSRDGLLEESLGPVRMSFRLFATNDAIEWRLSKVRSLGIPLPLLWFRDVSAREWIQDGVYHFDVRAALPLAGPLVRYSGTLEEVTRPR